MSMWNGLGSSYYFDMFKAFNRIKCRRTKENQPVRHQSTCPYCSRKLVNTYLRNNDDWRCKACWDKFDMEELNRHTQAYQKLKKNIEDNKGE